MTMICMHCMIKFKYMRFCFLPLTLIGACFMPAHGQLFTASGQTVKVTSANELYLLEGLNNNGTIDHLTVSGTAAQSLSGTGTIGSLVLNKSTGTSADKTATITAGAGNILSLTGVLTLTSGTLATNGNLTLKSTASATARLAAIPASGASITGNVTVERYIPAGRKWRFLTAPLTGSTNNSVFYNWQNDDLPNGATGVEIWGPAPYGTDAPSSSNYGLAVGPNPSMRSYGSSGWQGVTNTNTTLLFDNTTNYGYALFATGPYNNGSTSYIGGPGNLPAAAATTLSASGTLITGTHTKTLSANPNAGQYFLVGNPYAAPVYVKDLSGANLTGIFYMWDAAEAGTNQLGKYVGFDRTTGLYAPLTAGIPDSSTRLQSGQAFFARADQAGANTTITFEEADKALTSSNGMFGNGSLSDFGMLRLTLQLDAGGKSYNADGAVALFHANGNPAIDRFDGSKLMNSGENLFIRRSNVNLMFEHRPEIQTKDTVFLRLSNMQPQSYRLQLETKDLGIKEAYLIDTYAKKETTLSVNGTTDYDFTVGADSLSTGDRFRVVFAKAAAPVVVTPDTDGDEALRLYPNPVRDRLRVAVGVSVTGPFTATVFNAAGVEVWMKSGIAAGTKTVDVGTSALKSGVYTLVLTDAKGETRVEKFVKE